MVFDLLTIGWLLFVADSILTFVRPVFSYYLGLILAILALAASLPQSAHYAFFTNGAFLSGLTFVAGTVAQFIIVLTVSYRFVRMRGRDEWAWPGAK